MQSALATIILHIMKYEFPIYGIISVHFGFYVTSYFQLKKFFFVFNTIQG